MIKFKDWEYGLVILPDDVFIPIIEHNFLWSVLIGFKGQATGIVLSQEFESVLGGAL